MQSEEGKLQRKRKTETSIQKSEGAATRMVIHIQKKMKSKGRDTKSCKQRRAIMGRISRKKLLKKSIEKEKKQLLPVTFS